ncbi:MAG: hypothetical protein ACKO3T_19760, partial [Planctomycetaceae bacterium]
LQERSGSAAAKSPVISIHQRFKTPLLLVLVLVLVIEKPLRQPNRTPADSRPRLACGTVYCRSSAFISGSEKTQRADLGLESTSYRKTKLIRSRKKSRR